MEREREKFRVGEALRNAGPPSPHEPPPPVLPDLAQVKWSKADPNKTPHHPEVGVFGGWRIGDLSEEQRALAKRRREEARKGS